MKNKIIGFFALLFTTIFLFKSNVAFGAAFTIYPDDWENIIYVFDSDRGSCLCVQGSGYWYINNGDMRWGAPMLLGVAPGEFSSDNYISSGYGTLHNVTGYILIKGSIEIGQNNNFTDGAYDSYEDFENDNAPTWQENVVSAFYELYYDIFGFYPPEWTTWAHLANWLISTGEPDETIPDLEFPTNIPTPTATPIPTSIPYQIIYVPDGNGNTTKIYKYTDPETGNPTESPYDPNPTYQPIVTIPTTESPLYYPENPLKIDYDYFNIGWKAGGSQNEFDNPLLVGSESIDMVKGGVNEYDDSIKVVSNSFGALPSKWLILIGIVASIPIIAGIIKSMLGG